MQKYSHKNLTRYSFTYFFTCLSSKILLSSLLFSNLASISISQKKLVLDFNTQIKIIIKFSYAIMQANKSDQFHSWNGHCKAEMHVTKYEYLHCKWYKKILSIFTASGITKY